MSIVIRSTLLLLCLFCSLNVFSKDNYQPGYLVLVEGDTLRGFIDYKRWDKNPHTITFQKEESGAEQVYRTEDLKGFFVGGEHYISAIVEIDTSPWQVQYLTSTSPDPEIGMDTVFLKLLFKGDKSLFYLKDRNGKKQFYSSSWDEVPQLLILKKYFKDVEGPMGRTQIVAENEKYKNQLVWLFRDQPDMIKVVERTSYEIRPLIKTFNQYQELIGGSVKYQNDHKEVRVEHGFIVGPTVTALSFSGSDTYDYLSDGDFTTSVTPSFGFFVDWNSLRGKPIKLSTEGFFTYFKVNGEHLDVVGEDESYYTQCTFDFSYLKLNTLLSFKFFGNRPAVYGLAGGSFGYAISANSSVIETKEFYGLVTVREKEFDSPKVDIGWLLGVGTRFNNFSFEARYEETGGLSDYAGLESKTSRIHLLLRYTLSK